MPDSIDRLVADWAVNQPELDLSPVEVVARIGRIRAHMLASMNAVFEAHGLTDSDFATLSNLSRAGDDGCPMAALAADLGLTPRHRDVQDGSTDLPRLRHHGACPTDARVRIARITPRAMRCSTNRARSPGERTRATVSLTGQQREQLADLLRLLLSAYERPSS